MDETDSQLQGILEKAFHMEPGQRTLFLEKAFEENPSLGDTLAAFLQDEDHHNASFEAPIQQLLLDFLESQASNFGLPARIGPFRILGRLGEGGMGMVFLAYQSEPVKRMVALKIMKPTKNNKAAMGRFQTEYQALARLSHPHVAHVLDVGAVGEGQMFFSMEYVPGRAITEYCRDEALSITERIDLMGQVCRAIAHAHQKGIIHRDIKPSNILVNKQDGKPHARVIDFGIAKAISGIPLIDASMHTLQGMVLGTLAYLSPEQTEGSLADVDTRTDIFGLGAVLYELLTGQPPHDRQILDGLPLDRALVYLRSTQPVSPSIRVKQADTPQHRDRAVMLRGELDWIVDKALNHNPEMRYATVNAFAEDLERYLRREPIAAAPPSILYRLRTFYRRRKLAVTAVLFFSASLLIGSGLAAYGVVKARQSRDAEATIAAQMTRQAEKYVALYGFLEKMLRSSDPYVRDRDVKMTEVLDEISQEIEVVFHARPDMQIDLSSLLAKTYLGLGDAAQAVAHFRRVWKLQQTFKGPYNQTTLMALWDLAQCLTYLQELEEASEYVVFLETALAEWDLKNPLCLRTRRLRLWLLQMRSPQDAIAGYLQLLDDQVGVFDPSDHESQSARANLATAYRNAGRPEKAIPIYQRLVAERETNYGATHPKVTQVLNNLANACSQMKDFERALSYHHRVLNIRSSRLGQTHPETLNSIYNVGWHLYQISRFGEAETMLTRAYEGKIMILGADHRSSMRVRNTLAFCLLENGNEKRAMKLFRENHLMAVRKLGADDKYTLRYAHNLGGALSRAGHFHEAETLLLETLHQRARLHGTGSRECFNTRLDLGKNALFDRRPSQAAQWLEENLEHTQIQGNQAALAHTRAYLGVAMMKQGQRTKGKRLLDQAMADVLETGPEYKDIKRLIDWLEVL